MALRRIGNIVVLVAVGALGPTACGGPDKATLNVEVSGLLGADTAGVHVYRDRGILGTADWSEHHGLASGTHVIELPHGDVWTVACLAPVDYVASGDEEHTLTIADGDTGHVACRYDRGQPSLQVVRAHDGTEVESGQPAWDFLGVAVDETSPEAIIRLRNLGTARLHVHEVGTADPAFLIDAVAATASPIAVNSFADVRIRFRPVATAEYEATVTVAYEGGTFTFKVKGWGT